MKKTLTINIRGSIFHIDEDAYDKLNTYLDTLKRHFSHTQGKDEIIADIEGRIAELLQERISNAKQVISIEDVSEVIALMGDPGEFDDEETGDAESAKSSAEFDDTRGPKRLYRDPDRKVVGGVAAGLAAYLNIDVLWVRLAFIIFTLIWFVGALIYIALWIAMPEALTTAEKLQMKGEKVNISNIEKSIKDEVSHLKDKINDLTNQARESVGKKNKHNQNAFEQILSALLSVLRVVVRIVVIVIGIVLLLTGIALAVGFLVALFGWGGPFILDNNEAILIPFTDIFRLLPLSAGGSAILKLGLLFFLGIPLLMLMYNAFRMIFGIERIRYIGITALNLWIVGLIITLFFSFRIAREYRQPATIDNSIPLEQPLNDTLHLTVNNEFLDELLYNSYDYIHADELHLVITEEGEVFDQIEVDITQADQGAYVLRQLTTARGRSVRMARENAVNTLWYFKQEGNSLILDPYFTPGEPGSWRAQHIRIKVEVPEGKYIHIDKNMRDLLNWGRYSPYKLSGKTWIMTEKGLSDPNEPEMTSSSVGITINETQEHIAKHTIMQVAGLLWP